MASYQKLCNDILNAVGGEENISSVAHCATRLRLTLHNTEKTANDEEIKSIKGVLGLVKIDNCYQIIIGPGVDQVYLAFLKCGKFQEDGECAEKETETTENGQKMTPRKMGVAVIDFITGSFMPVLPVIVAGGLISALLVVFTTFLGLSTDSGVYIVLNAIYSAAFTYLPIYVGYNTAKKLNISPMLGALLGGVLVCSNISGVEGLSFAGIPVTTVDYSQSVFPVMFGVLFMSLIYRPLEKHMPKEIKFVMVPTLTMLVTVPVTLIALGPVATWIGNLLAAAILWLNTHLGWLSVGLMAAYCPILLFTGTGGSFYPVIFASFAQNGFEGFAMTGLLAANPAIGGAALAASMMLKNRDDKSLAVSTGLTALFGITEPAIYGILIRFKKPFIASIIGAGIGGLFAGFNHVVEYVFSSPSVISIIAFINPDGTMKNFYMAIITMVIAFVSSFLITRFMGISETGEETQKNRKGHKRT